MSDDKKNKNNELTVTRGSRNNGVINIRENMLILGVKFAWKQQTFVEWKGYRFSTMHYRETPWLCIICLQL